MPWPFNLLSLVDVHFYLVFKMALRTLLETMAKIAREHNPLK